MFDELTIGKLINKSILDKLQLERLTSDEVSFVKMSLVAMLPYCLIAKLFNLTKRM